MRRVQLHNLTHPLSQKINVKYCDSFVCRLFGLMFRPNLAISDGLLMVQKSENKLDAAIHMLFMNFNLTIVWLDKNMKVVDVQLVPKWKLAYIPKQPAKYVLEIHPEHSRSFQPGDQVAIEKCV